MDNYYQKYMKYKNKYLELKKNIIGGEDPKKYSNEELITNFYTESFLKLIGKKFFNSSLEEILKFNKFEISKGKNSLLDLIIDRNIADSKVTFGEIIKPYFDSLPRDKTVDEFNEEDGLYGKNAGVEDDIKRSIIKEEENNNITNLFG